MTRVWSLLHTQFHLTNSLTCSHYWLVLSSSPHIVRVSFSKTETSSLPYPWFPVTWNKSSLYSVAHEVWSALSHLPISLITHGLLPVPQSMSLYYYYIKGVVQTLPVYSCLHFSPQWHHIITTVLTYWKGWLWNSLVHGLLCFLIMSPWVGMGWNISRYRFRRDRSGRRGYTHSGKVPGILGNASM